MATCSIQTLLDDATCFSTQNTAQLDAIALQLWCQITANINPTPGEGDFWYNPGTGVWVNPDVGSAPISNPAL